MLASCSARQGWVGQSKCQNSSEPYVETAENASETLKIARNRSKSLEIARNRSNLASADVTLQLRLGFWPVKSGQCSNVLPIVSVVGPNYQFQLLPTLSSMILEILTPARPACAAARARTPALPIPRATGHPLPHSITTHSLCVPGIVQVSTRAFERGAVRLLGACFLLRNAFKRPKFSSGAPPRAP